MNKIIRIQVGESLPFKFDRGGEDIDGYTCTIKVKQYPGDAAAIERVITPDASDRSWPGFLTNTETSALTTGLWFLTAFIVNLTTDEVEQVPVRFGVAPSWV